LPTDPGFDSGLLSPLTVRVERRVSDGALVAALVRAEVAFIRALARVGVAAPGTAAAVEAAASELEIDAPALATEAVADGNPVIPLVRRLREAVATRDAEAARWVHRGATSQDILDTALALVAADAVGAIDADLERAARALATLAERRRGTVAAARTLTQFAVPTTLGLRFADWLVQVLDARDALTGAIPPAQLGGAAGTLAALDELFGARAALELPGAFAGELGLPEPTMPWHVRRTAMTRLGDALVAVTDPLARIGTDVATLARPEIGELAESGGGGSSTMPQKRNPARSVLLRAAGMRAPALAAQLHVSAALAVDERPDGAWHAEWPALRELARLALGAAATAAELLEGLEVDEDAVARNVAAAGDALVSERLMLALEPRLGRSAVQALVDRAAAGEPLATLLAAEPALAGVDVEALLDPAGYTGVAGQLIDRALARASAPRPEVRQS